MDQETSGSQTDFIEIPDFKWPTVSIGIESIYGMGGINGPIDGINFDRQGDESNEELAKRIGSAVENLVLRSLQENDEYRLRFEKSQAEKQ